MTQADACIPRQATDHQCRFTGKERDTESGNDYFGARYYDPTIDRFISEDPSGFAGGINVYAYAYDDPIDFGDPSGLKPPDPGPSCGGQGAGCSPDPNCSGSGGGSTTQQRLLQAAHGALNLGIGVAKMATGIGLAVGTDGLAAGVGYYAFVDSFGNYGAAASQFAGAVSGNVEQGEQGAQASEVVFSPFGMTTYLATGGNVQDASTAASMESVITAPAIAGFTGDLPEAQDWGDLGQNVNDLASQNGSCQ
jgi:RHS repeat-associated protein